jgi:hypothetical protein
MFRIENIPNKGRGYISNVDIEKDVILMNVEGFVFIESNFIKWRHQIRAEREFGMFLFCLIISIYLTI